MIKNTIKQLWSDGKPALNGWLSIGNAFSAEIMAAQDFDSVTVDLQHGALDYNSALPMFQAMRASGKTLMARVPWNEPGIIMKALDGGAYGIICPMINNRAEAEQFVSAMRYPPHGTRSFGPTRVNFAAGANYAGEANDEVLAIAMIETAQGVANAKEIVSTPGLDAIYIGPSDLTLGVTQGRLPPGQDREEAEMIEVIQSLLATAHDAGIHACIHTASASYAAKAIGWGFDLATVATDVALLVNGARSTLAEARDLMER
ncbi:MAG: 2,4-dihydroxyhept-2-ene-1,7-dioic acid aldolase [Silicimonas sp.]|nr:2,4-dihydroxyhept-2-ene-1,7-dioic acid aldolase [Silicimonas sp.]